VIKVDHEAHGVDTPEDVGKLESLMRERNLSWTQIRHRNYIQINHLHHHL